MFQKIKNLFQHSETIFLARVEALVGFVIATVSAFDWSPLLNMNFDTGFSKTQALVLGGIMFVKGLFSELARRAGTITVNDQLVPTDLVKKPVLKVKK